MRSAMVGHSAEPRTELFGVKCPAKTYVMIAPSFLDAERWITEMAGECLACGGARHSLLVAQLGEWETFRDDS